jgi:hypothetical protein
MNKLMPLSLVVVLASAALADLPRNYEILGRKSIFARDRVSRVAGSERLRWQSSPARSSVPVLIGILREEAGFAAALESPDTGKQTQVRIGDALPGNAGTVSDITLDYLEFVTAAGQPPTRVPVGRNLQGAETSVAAPATQPATQPTTGEAAPAPAEGDDLLSRMRQRRQQEMNR